MHRIPGGSPGAFLLVVMALGLPTAQGQVEGAQYAVTRYWSSAPADARTLMRGPKGRLWVGSGDGTVRILEDGDGDGTAETVRMFVAGAWSPHGLAWRSHGRGWDVYVAHLTAPYGGTGRITRFVDEDGDDVFESVHTVVLSMPSGAHQVNNLAMDPGGEWLWFSQGATHDRSPGGGALVGRVDPLAEDLPWGDPGIHVVATGLRNAWGLAFHPGGELFATDNGRDDVGAAAPPDELNRIVEGRDYGFPDVGGMPPAGHPSEPPVGLLDVHGSADGLCFDDGQALSGFRHQLFIAEWGSWDEPRTARILQAEVHEDALGRWHLRRRDFLVGCGRPLDVCVGPKGALFFTVQTETPGWPLGVYRVTPRWGVAVRLCGFPAPGRDLAVRVVAPDHAGERYQIGVSFGHGPFATPRGDLGLSPDALLELSLRDNPWLDLRRPGVLDARGRSAGPDVIHIPPHAALSGRTVFVGAVTFDLSTGSLTGIAPPATLTIL